jgi:putative Holliday junction resolvase
VTVPDRGRVLGVDLGARRIGVAVCDDAQRVATPVTIVGRVADADAHRRGLAALVAEYDAVGAVVGLPRSLSGEMGPAARGVLEEVEALRVVLPVPVDTVDERLTTVTATAGLRAVGRQGRGRRVEVDASAAAVILQAWLDRRAAAS